MQEMALTQMINANQPQIQFQTNPGDPNRRNSDYDQHTTKRKASIDQEAPETDENRNMTQIEKKATAFSNIQLARTTYEMVNGVKVAKQQTIASLNITSNTNQNTIGTFYKPKKVSLGGDDINDLKIRNDLSNLATVKGADTGIDGVQTITLSATNIGPHAALQPKILNETDYGSGVEGAQT